MLYLDIPSHWWNTWTCSPLPISTSLPATAASDAPRAPPAGPRRPCRAGSPSWKQPRPAPVRTRRAHAQAHRRRDARCFERTGALLTEIDETAAAIASGGHGRAGDCGSARPAVLADRDGQARRRVRRSLYPEVRLEVTTEDRAVDMIEEGYDLVIRVNPDPDASLVGRIFLRDRLVVVASPSARARRGPCGVPAVVRGVRSDRSTGR
jgi:hypothetical protein